MREPAAVLVPQMNPNDEHAVLVSWHVASGSRVNADQAVAVVETTKVTFDVHAPCEGYLFFEHPPGTKVAIGAAIAWVTEEPKAPVIEAVAVRSDATEQLTSDSRFTRKALHIMKQHGLTAADFPGSGRIEAQDVERRLAERAAAKPAAADDAEPLEQSPSKVIEAARLGDVYRNVVPSTVAIALSCTKLDARLRQLAAQFGPLSLLELAIYELMRLLPGYPDLNGYFAGGRAWRYRSVAIGFAINLGKSLKVPVVRCSAAASPIDVARAVRDLALRYMRDRLTMEDMTGCTFTVTDLSTQSVVHFVPVLNDKQAAILGLCAERPGTGYRELVLTFDHRMTDGMRAAAFLGALRERLEESA
jgi:2-oxoglutarate dehydrogenase E2 component (dihydrolipoamide succinyltransferase)